MSVLLAILIAFPFFQERQVPSKVIVNRPHFLTAR
jgi:hypothetical protein